MAALMKALGHTDAQTAMKYQHPGLEQIRIAVDARNREHAEMACSERSPHSPELVRQVVLEKMVSAEGIEPSTY